MFKKGEVVKKGEDGKNNYDNIEDPPQKKEENSNNNAKKEEEGVAPPSLGRFMKTVKSEQPVLIFGMFLLFLAEAGTQVIPKLVANAYDAIVYGTEEERMEDVNYYMTLSIVIFLASMIANYFRGCIFTVAGERMVARLRNDLYSSILDQDIAFFDAHKSGELLSRLGNDTTLLQGVVSLSIPEAIVNITKAIVSIVLIFTISPELAGMSIGTIFAICLLSAPLGLSLGKLSKSYQDALGKATTYSTESIGSMRTVQSFTAENKEKKRYKEHIGDPDMYPYWWPYKNKTDSTYSVGFWKSMVTTGFYTIIFGGVFGLLYVVQWYGFYLVNKNQITIGDITAFQTYVFSIGLGLGTASSHVAKILEGFGASGRVFYLLDCIPSIPTTPKDDKSSSKKSVRKPDSIEGRLKFNNVSFAYPSRPQIDVLDGYTLSIPPGSTTALVGSSGSGKSTVVALLQRFYDVKSGSITVDDNDIRDLDLKWLRQRIGYVQQEPQLFGLSVRENLLYGIPDDEDETTFSEEKIIQACRDANCHDFISSWPEGYDTLVGERGVKLSGGQKQRISIARALLTNCRILLLDEATSALDAESEHLVQEAIDKAVVGRTVVIVAHRLSTIQRAEQVVVMSNHKIVDVGTHDYLLGNCRKYQELIKRQSMKPSASMIALNTLYDELQ
eukprot:CAMPEP_0194144044 /NCGR_PEP_ID=MMETSP0152-20130528/13131_1 /TAXON_ID=1049557 /ORGANISM="Thalassiothrix antarctica, Strain L6-D1" /LENGTH=669 /DNA_ID=CAMNT_0038843721 /DNA_START=20 /DNA_END=2029 /DNA_ORIENTATION=-